MAETTIRYGAPQVVTRYVPEQWDESQGGTPQVLTTPKQGFRAVQAHKVTYADGSVEVWVLNQNGEEAAKIADAEPVEALQKKWEEQKKAQTPTATTQATQIEDRTLGTHPTTGKPAWRIQHPDGTVTWDEANVPATAATDTPTEQNAAELQRQRERNRDAGAGYYTDEEISKGLVAKQKDDEAKAKANQPTWTKTYKNGEGKYVQAEVGPDSKLTGNVRAVPDEAVPEDVKQQKPYLSIKQDENTGVWHGLTEAGKWEPLEGGPGLKPEKPTVIDPSTSKAVLTTDENGNPVAKPIAGTGEQPGPDIGPLGKAKIGEYSQKLADRWEKRQELVRTSGGSYTMEQARKDIETDRKMLESAMNEEVAQLNAQQNIRGQDVQQRGQTLQDAGNRQQLASTAASNALSMVQKFPGIAKVAGNGANFDAAIKYLMGLPINAARENGGLPDQSPIPRTPQQVDLMGGQQVPGINITINGAGGAGGMTGMGGLSQSIAAGGPGLENPAAATPIGMPGNMDQLIDMNADPNDPDWNNTLQQINAERKGVPTPNSVVGSAVDPSMSFRGGQLRAPGVGPVGAGPVGTVG